jgi:hypothetical protein
VKAFQLSEIRPDYISVARLDSEWLICLLCIPPLLSG